MMSINYIWRKILFSMTRWQGQKIRVWALRKLGFSIGNQVYIGPGLTMAVGIADMSMSLTIGDRVAFGPNVTLLLASHPSYSKLQRVVTHPTRKIIIGEDSWLGANSVVMPNVTIGKCCIVGSGAVVTHDVPDYSVVAGVPARVIKKIDPEKLQ